MFIENAHSIAHLYTWISVSRLPPPPSGRKAIRPFFRSRFFSLLTERTIRKIRTAYGLVYFKGINCSYNYYSNTCNTLVYSLFKLGQDVCKHSSVFNVLLYRTTLLKQTENVALLWNIQALAQLLDNL